MKHLKVIDKYSYSQNFGAGFGDVIEIVYECPCGKGSVREINDKVPGFRSHDIFINCDECLNKWNVKAGGIATLS